MSITQILLIIAIATIATTIIQCIEMYLILYNQRKTNWLLENIGVLASNGFSQFIHELITDKKKEAEFFGFVQLCGQHAINAGKDAVQKKMPRVKSLGDVIGFLLQMPAVQAKVEKVVAGPEAAPEAAVPPGWG